MREILGEVIDVSRKCSKYGMCKVDYLSTGLCPPAKERLFACYFPQGRMEIATALYDGAIPVTEQLVEIVKSCLLCNICDRQCYFVMELKPLRVMRALADYVDAYLAAGLPVVRAERDDLVDALTDVVGEGWVSNDPAVVVCYSRARSPALPRRMPRCVVLPGSADEVAAVVRTARRHGVEVLPRGNGTSLAGVVGDGIVVLDLIRLGHIGVDADNWCADIGAGVTAFDLQRAAHEHGLRANTAEPAACVCANIISTNLHSLFSHSYGMGDNNLVDAQFVTFDGDVVRLDAGAAASLLHFRDDGPVGTPPAICTGMRVKLHPVPPDEDVVVVPFAEFPAALALAGQLATRRLGSAVGLLGVEYVANFTAVTAADAARNEQVLRDRLGINYMLIVVGDRFAVDAVRQLAGPEPVLGQDVMRLLLLGLPGLHGDQALELIAELSADGAPYRELLADEMLPVLTMSLSATADSLTRSADPQLRRFLTRLYSRPHMTDIRWLTTFRAVSARIGRGKTFVPRIVWVPVDRTLIEAMVHDLAAIGDKHGIKNGFGYLVPIDLGKRVIVEFDYFYDHTSPAESAAMVEAMTESQALLDRLRADTAGVTLGSEIALQGLSRPESYLYRQRGAR